MIETIHLGKLEPVATGELPDEITKAANSLPARAGEAKTETMGLQLRDAKPAGAMVVGTLVDSPASRALLFPDDIVTGVEGQKINDAADCVSAIATSLVARGSKGVLLNIERKGQRTFVILQP